MSIKVRIRPSHDSWAGRPRARVVLKIQKSRISCTHDMQIFVRSSAGSVAVQCLSSDRVEDVKSVISERTGLKEPELAYNGRVLEDVCTLDDYLVSEEATLDAYVPMLGGALLCSLHAFFYSNLSGIFSHHILSVVA